MEYNQLMNKIAEELKGKVKAPNWAPFVKTGPHKERPPVDKEWWYTRLASILLTVKDKGPIGVSKLRTKYGGKKRRGYKPSTFMKGSGSIVRKAMQQLEEQKLVQQAAVGVHKGRVITKEGAELINKVKE
ncbi:MAG: 30S ribosomal protein S19e [Nanobdellota archaeon]